MEHVHADSVNAQTEPDKSTCPLCTLYVDAQPMEKEDGKNKYLNCLLWPVQQNAWRRVYGISRHWQLTIG